MGSAAARQKWQGQATGKRGWIERLSGLMRYGTLLALALALGGVAVTQTAQAGCLTTETKRYSGTVALLVGASNFAPPNPYVDGARRMVVAGTAVGELVDFGISYFWDPHLDVFPNDPANIVTQISDAQIIGIADTLLADIGGPFTVTYPDLLALNALSSGMGDAASQLLLTGVRTFANVLQGAAAFAQDGYSSAQVISAALLVNGDLSAFGSALNTYSGYVVSLDGTPGYPNITKTDYLDFLTKVATDGASAVPAQEIAIANDILGLANDHLVGTTFGDALANYLVPAIPRTRHPCSRRAVLLQAVCLHLALVTST